MKKNVYVLLMGEKKHLPYFYYLKIKYFKNNVII